MIVFSNRRLGPASELLVSAAVAEAMLRETAVAAHPAAEARWEHELVRWLESRVARPEAATLRPEAATLEDSRGRPADPAIPQGHPWAREVRPRSAAGELSRSPSAIAQGFPRAREARPRSAAGELDRSPSVIDVSEIAWTPENFDRQRRFVVQAIEQAAETSEHARALRWWAQMIEAHPKDSVQFGRLWTSQPSF